MPQAPTPPIKDIVITSDDPELIEILKEIKQTLDIREGRLGDTQFRFIDYSELVDLLTEGLAVSEALKLLERSSDPAEPAEGETVIWMSDGTGKGDDGDVMIASKAGGTTNYGTLFDHSAGTAW